MAQVEKVIVILRKELQLPLNTESALLGGCAVDASGEPLPAATLDLCKQADGVLLGAVGGPKWDTVSRELRPESGLLQLRAALEVFANLRPAIVYPELADASSLQADLVSGLDIMIVRELTGGLYFGQPRGIEEKNGERYAYNTMVYSTSEISRIADVAFTIAAQRRGQVCSVDKANVLEVSQLWREVVTAKAAAHPDITLTHMYVDNAAMQLVKQPSQFDVLLTGNIFGDILSDLAAMLTGSIGMLPSASLNASGQGIFEPVHGSAPDIAGQDKANPLAMLLSFSMLLRTSLGYINAADLVELAVKQVLAAGLRTTDIAAASTNVIGTEAMGDAVCQKILEHINK